MQTILLISQSPRRREILSEAGYKFFVDTVKVSESFDKNVNPLDAVLEIAKRKAQAYLDSGKLLKSKGILAVSADTVVVHAGQILGKPKTKGQAVEYLRSMSGATHQVLTAVFAKNLDTGECFSLVEKTEVEFLKLKDSAITAYVETGDPMDKAGAYGIQGPAREFIKEFRGSYLNVVGFPLEAFQAELEARDWVIDKN